MSHLRATAVVIPLFLLLPALLDAQGGLSPADVKRFEGTWTLDVERSGVTSPERRTITVSPQWIRVETERPEDDRPPVLIYRLDGAENINPYGIATATSRLRREGENLITETVFTIRDQPVTVTEVLHLSASGADMTVETTLRVEHGYQGVQPPLEARAPNMSKATTVFHRQR